VEGTVYQPLDQQSGGCTVTIEGANWSDAVMTNDAGGYGFHGLCAGNAVVRAHLPNGQSSQGANVSLDGVNSVHLDLTILATAEGTVPGAQAAQETATAEPEMPATGYSTWWLLGGALLGALLLLSAGARRLLGIGPEAGDGE
jgi:hypothetical protein